MKILNDFKFGIVKSEKSSYLGLPNKKIRKIKELQLSIFPAFFKKFET